ncbi:OmpA family protein [Lutibacter sp.]|uniref:OmpA family protein n=1 Tax=Lutibacter sp. TaxID=1925666 RepID=UPI0025C6BBFE|nr:OmpA family protein [Lutibacter sp.]MCF6181666.1 carboxypeptidase regulatory-like domain-containing protein [Lutibacter sp.]
MKFTKLAILFTFIIGLTILGDKSRNITIPKSSLNQKLLINNNCKTTISGKILDKETKTPISNAQIILISNGQEIKKINVNEKGTYSFKLNCGNNYKIKVKAASYFNIEYLLTTSKNNSDSIFKNFLLEKKCYQTITGTIINEFSNKTVDNAIATLYLDGEEIETTQVDKVGIYSFKVKCNSNYYIIVNKLNFINDLFEFSTSTSLNKIIKHDFILEPECIQTISGVIKNKVTLEPISSTLKLYLNNIEIETINVNNDGNFLVKFQCTTNYKIVASRPDYKEDSYNFLTDYTENKQPDYFHLKKDLFLEPNQCFQVVLGKVLDKETEKVIPNAQVSLYFQNQEIKTFQTNYDGSYFFNVKCNDSYDLVTSKEGMTTETVNYIANEKKGDNKTLNIYLEAKNCDQIVNGVIIDKNTKLPISNTKVTLLENNLFVNSVKTNQNGAYSFHIICDTSYKIEATNAEYNKNSIDFSSDKTRNATISKSIALTPLDCNQVITGIITDKNTKQPIANTKVSLFENNAEINSIKTSDNGEFNFTINCNSSYKIEAENTEYSKNSITFSSDKTRDDNISKSIILTPLDCNQVITGIILDKNTKQPIANTKVSLFENNAEINSITTSDNGEFNFTINCNSSYKIEATNTEYSKNSITFSSDKTRNKVEKTQIILDKKECKQLVTGIIRDKINKTPLPNTTITLYQNNKVIGTKTVGEDGKYKFKLNCQSTYKLSVFKNNQLESFRIKTAVENGRVLHLNFDIEPLNCVQYLNGIVTENISNNAIPGAEIKLLISNKEVKKTFSDSNGTFYFELDCKKNYVVIASKTNYTSEKKTVSTITKIGHPHTLKFSLEPIIKVKEKNRVKYIETKSINFDLDEFELTKEAKIELNKVVFNLNQNPKFKVEINYYTDSRGPDEYNLELTQKRADASKDYLISKGVNPSRIKATGYGETHLLNRCKNNVKCTDAEHAINRRTDFIIIPN